MKGILSALLVLFSIGAYAENHTVKASEGSSSTKKETSNRELSSVKVLSQQVATRLAKILRVNANSDSPTLQAIVTLALKQGRQMDEIRTAVTQATKDVTGQVIKLDNKNIKTESSTDNPVLETTPPTSAPFVTPKNATPDTIALLPNESLFRLAQRVYGKENGRRYLDIFAANRDQIKDINVVHEGLILKLPPD